MMDRRRALMASGDKQLCLKDIPIGAYFKEAASSVLWIYCGVESGNCQLIRDQVLSSASKLRNDTLCDYEGGVIDTYLTGAYYNAQSEALRSAMADSEIAYSASDGSTVVTKTITRKIYIPTYAQSNYGKVIAGLRANRKGTNDNYNRAAMDSGGNYRAWWTMSAASTTKMHGFGTSGNDVSYVPNIGSGTVYRRPMISLKQDTLVELMDGIYVLAH